MNLHRRDELPDGKVFNFWECQTEFRRTYYVSQNHQAACDDNAGDEGAPFRTIGKAAAVVKAGEKVVIDSGLYREFVRPLAGGTAPDTMISYEAAPGATAIISGAEIWDGPWEKSEGWGRPRSSVSGTESIWMGRLPQRSSPGSNPFAMTNVTSPPWVGRNGRLPENKDGTPYLLRRGILFVDGQPLKQVHVPQTLFEEAGTFWVEDDGLSVHFRLAGDGSPAEHLIEYTAREQAFSPAGKEAGYIRVKGLCFERVGNGIPGFQRGALSTHCGHHWIIEGNIVRWANSVGIDVGIQNPRARCSRIHPGFHVIRNNTIQDCGICGLCGVPSDSHSAGLEDVLVEGNRFERICRLEAERNYESAALKLHRTRNCLIRNNVIVDTINGAGIWLDYTNVNSRLSNNVIVRSHSIFGGIFMEASEKPNLLDGNLIYDVKAPQGEVSHEAGNGIYEHDCDYLRIENNLIAKADGAGVFLNRGEINRVLAGADSHGAIGRRHRLSGNIITDCGMAVIVPCPDNVLDENCYGRFTKPYWFKVQNPEELLNLDYARDFHGWEVKGRKIEIDLALDVVKNTLCVLLKSAGTVRRMDIPLDGKTDIGAIIRELLLG